MAKRISCNVSDEMYERIQHDAALDGMSVPQFLRDTIYTMVGTPESDAEYEALKTKMNSDPLLKASIEALTHDDDLLPREPTPTEWLN